MKECFCPRIINWDFWQSSLLNLRFPQSSKDSGSLLIPLCCTFSPPLSMGPSSTPTKALPSKIQNPNAALEPIPAVVPSWLIPPTLSPHLALPYPCLTCVHYNLATLEYPLNLKMYPALSWHPGLPNIAPYLWPFLGTPFLDSADLPVTTSLTTPCEVLRAWLSVLIFLHAFIFLCLLLSLTIHLRGRSFQGSIFSFIIISLFNALLWMTSYIVAASNIN